MTLLKIGIIGVGRLGSVLAYRLLTTGIAKEIYLVDIKKDLAWGVAEDLKHALGSIKRDIVVNYSNDLRDLSNMDLILVTAGKPRVPGIPMTREELAEANAGIIREIALTIANQNPGAKYIIITNPVDVMATLFLYYSRTSHVYSSGCSLDSARLRWFTAKEAHVKPNEVTGFVIGSHGVVHGIAESLLFIKGVHAQEFFGKKYNEFIHKAKEYVNKIAKQIIDATGATVFGPVEVFTRIVQGFAGIELVESIGVPYSINGYKVFVSMPSMITSSGATVLPNLLSKEERKILDKAAQHVLNVFSNILRKVEK